MGSDFRWFLRERTGAAHDRLDDTIGQFGDRASYGHYVRSLFRFRAPVERALSPLTFPQSFGSYRPTTLEPWIVADLRDLGLGVPDLDLVSLDLGGAGLIGVLYVLEGASLGARVLVKRAAALGFSAGNGASHLTVAARGDSWPELLAILAQSDDLDADRAADAALATFELAQRAFEGVAA